MPLEEAVGRGAGGAGLGGTLVAPFDAAAMDGIAVRAGDTVGASDTAPARLEPGAYEVVDTGDPPPPSTPW